MQQHRQSLLAPLPGQAPPANGASPLHHRPSRPGEGEEATASLACPEKGWEPPGEGVQEVPARHRRSGVPPNPAEGCSRPYLQKIQRPQPCKRRGDDRGNPVVVHHPGGRWGEVRGGDPGRQGGAPAFSTGAAPAGGALPLLPTSFPGHPSPEGLPPSEARSPASDPAQAGLAEALDPAAESGFLHSQGLLDLFPSLLLRNKDKLETICGIRGHAWLLRSPLACLHHRPPSVRCSSSCVPPPI